MATRLSVITTRGGDDGTTGLGDGSRVPKDDARITALGDVDELNSTLGLLRTESLPTDIDHLLRRIQNQLFDLGAELCIPGHAAVQPDHVAQLDAAIAHYNADLGQLTEFILPGGSRAADAQFSGDEARQYLTRLSELCFVLARTQNKSAGTPDVLWQRD